MIKDFLHYLNEEITIKGNEGIPNDKLSEIERKGAEKIRGENPGRLIPEIMRLVGLSQRLTVGKTKEIEELAEKVIRETFGTVVEGIDLDIRLVGDGNDVNDFMEREEEEKKEEQEREKEREKEKGEDNDDNEDNENRTSENEDDENLTPSQIKKAVHKRKIVNNIIQGEAKNTKNILHTEVSKDGLRDIFGDNWEEIFNIWDNISKIADKLDWIIPIEHKADMLENAPGGMAGATSARFPENDDESEEGDESGGVAGGDDDDGGDSDYGKVTKPTVRAVGIDYPMLLHETVKGIYELIADVGMPSGEKLATEVHRQTSSFRDEAEDFRYGPYLAQHLNDFIMLSKNIDRYPNIKEYVFGKLIDSSRWSDEECLSNLKNIFSSNQNGRLLIDRLVDETISELDEYQDSIRDWEKKEFDRTSGSYAGVEDDDNDDGFAKPGADEEDEIEKIIKNSNKEKDYSEMNSRELQEIVDQLLDDYSSAASDGEKNSIRSEIGKVTAYLNNESKQIYQMELERINESSRFHTRRTENKK